jgi:hypothetical protein
LIRLKHGQIDGLIIENFVELSHEFFDGSKGVDASILLCPKRMFDLAELRLVAVAVLVIAPFCK